MKRYKYHFESATDLELTVEADTLDHVYQIACSYLRADWRAIELEDEDGRSIRASLYDNDSHIIDASGRYLWKGDGPQ